MRFGLVVDLFAVAGLRVAAVLAAPLLLFLARTIRGRLIGFVAMCGVAVGAQFVIANAAFELAHSITRTSPFVQVLAVVWVLCVIGIFFAGAMGSVVVLGLFLVTPATGRTRPPG